MARLQIHRRKPRRPPGRQPAIKQPERRGEKEGKSLGPFGDPPGLTLAFGHGGNPLAVERSQIGASQTELEHGPLCLAGNLFERGVDAVRANLFTFIQERFVILSGRDRMALIGITYGDDVNHDPGLGEPIEPGSPAFRVVFTVGKHHDRARPSACSA